MHPILMYECEVYTCVGKLAGQSRSVYIRSQVLAKCLAAAAITHIIKKRKRKVTYTLSSASVITGASRPRGSPRLLS